jgi:hypothetical protein
LLEEVSAFRKPKTLAALMISSMKKKWGCKQEPRKMLFSKRNRDAGLGFWNIAFLRKHTL